MQAVRTFLDQDRKPFDVPEGDQEAFLAEAQRAGVTMTPAETWQDASGQKYDVPETEREGFLREFGDKPPERVRQVRVQIQDEKGNLVPQTMEVADSQRDQFLLDYRKDPTTQKDRAEVRQQAQRQAGPEQSVALEGTKGFAKGFGQGLQDAGVSIMQGVVTVPQTVVGLGNMVSGGAAGRAVEQVVDLKGAADFLAQQHSEDYRQRQQEFQQAQGIGGKLQALASSPQIVAGATLESLPGMAMGGLVGRGVVAAAGMLGKVAPQVARALGAAAGGIGEGAVTAGQALEQVRAENPDGYLTPKQTALLTASGALTGALGVLGNKMAKWLKIADVDTLASGAAGPAERAGVARRVLGGALAEGGLEELPQSIQEQVAQNLARGKPWDEGVTDAAVLGTVVGGLMGAGGNIFTPDVGWRMAPTAEQQAAPGTPRSVPQPPPLPNEPGAPQAGPQPSPDTAPAGRTGRVPDDLGLSQTQLDQNARVAAEATAPVLQPQTGAAQAPQQGAQAAQAAQLPPPAGLNVLPGVAASLPGTPEAVSATADAAVDAHVRRALGMGEASAPADGLTRARPNSSTTPSSPAESPAVPAEGIEAPTPTSAVPVEAPAVPAEAIESATPPAVPNTVEPGKAPDVDPNAPAEKAMTTREEVRLAAEKKTGFPLKAGGVIELVTDRSGKAYKKPVRAKILGLVDDSTVRISYVPAGQKYNGTNRVVEDVPINGRLAAPMSSQAARRYQEQLKGLTPEQRRGVQTAAREFDDLIRQHPGLYEHDKAAALESGQNQKFKAIGLSGLLKDARAAAAKAMGLSADEIHNPVVRAKELQHLKDWINGPGMEYGDPDSVDMHAKEKRRIKQMEPETINVGNLQAGDQVFDKERKEWFIVEMDDANGVIRLRDGTSLDMDAFDTMDVAGGENGIVRNPFATGSAGAANTSLDPFDPSAEDTFTLEQQTPEQVTQEQRDAAEREKRKQERQDMLDRQTAPIDGGVGDLYQGSLGAEFGGEENLFNQAPRAGKGADGARGYAEPARGSAGNEGGRMGNAGGPLGVAAEDNREHSEIPMDLPEMGSMVKALSGGQLPRVLQKLRMKRALGVFRPSNGTIELLQDVFRLVPKLEEGQLRRAAFQWAVKELGENASPQELQSAARGKFEQDLYELTEARKKTGPVWAFKVLAHEIGHLVDWLPDHMLARGNVLGHIAALKKHMKHAIPGFVGGPGPITSKERKQMMDEVRSALHAASVVVEEIVRQEPVYSEQVLTIKPENITALLGTDGRDQNAALYEWFARQDGARKKEILRQALKGTVDAQAAKIAGVRRVQTGWQTVVEQVVKSQGVTEREIQEEFRKQFEAETRRRKVLDLAMLKKELGGAIAWWRGTGETADQMEDYFKSPEEMYAEGYSIFLNNPAALAKRAPMFYQGLKGYMSARPQVQAEWDRIQELYKSGQVARTRVVDLRESWSKDREVEQRQLSEMTNRTTWREKKSNLALIFDRKSGPLVAMVKQYDPDMLDPLSGELRGAMKDMLHKGQSIELFLDDVNNRVSKMLAQAGLDWNDLAEYAFHQRVINDRRDLANPGFWHIKLSNERLNEMRDVTHKGKFNTLESAWREFREIYENGALELVISTGAWNKQQAKLVRENEHYATFAVTDTMEEKAKRLGMDVPKTKEEAERMSFKAALDSRFGTEVSSMLYAQYGTPKNIKNPMTATVSKAVSLISFAYNNRAKMIAAEWLRNSGDPMVESARRKWNGKGWVPEKKETSRIGTIMWMENGEVKGLHVPRAIADGFNRLNASPDRLALWSSMRGANEIGKAIMTRLSPGFWSWNSNRDRRTWTFQLPGAEKNWAASMLPLPPEWMPEGTWKDPRTYEYYVHKAKTSAKSMAKGEPNEQARSFMKRGMGISRAEFLADLSENTDIERLMLQYNIVPVGMSAKDMKPLARMHNALRGAWSWYLSQGEIRENTAKIAGMMYLDKMHPGMPEWEKRRLVTEMAGSPDFLESGTANQYIDFFGTSFYNARKEGLRSVVNTIRERPVESMRKYMTNTAMPAVLRWGLASGAFLAVARALRGVRPPTEEDTKVERMLHRFKKLYDAVPDYYKYVYQVYPLAFLDDKETKVLAITLPMFDMEQKMHTTQWAIMDGMAQSSGVSPKASGISKMLVSNLSGDLPLAWNGGPLKSTVMPSFEYYVMGRMPQDSFRGSDLLTQDQFDAGGRAAAEGLLVNAFNSSGAGGLIKRMAIKDPTEPPPGAIEKFLTAPFVASTIGRWVRVIDKGRDEQVRQEEKFLIQASAETREDVRRAMRQANANGDRLPDWAAKRMLADHDFAAYWTSLQRLKAEREALTPEERAVVRPRTMETKALGAQRLMQD